jgi:electron transport complex protein RnfG
MRNTLKLGLFLLLIAGIAGLGIAYVNELTQPLIAAQQEEEQLASLKEVYAEAENVVDESEQYLDENTGSIVTQVNVAYQGDDPVGVIYLVEPDGYSGKIQLMAGFDIATKKMTGIKVLSQTETPGLGSNAQESFFTERFKGKTVEKPLEIVKKEPVDDNQVLAITSATITSKAVANGVNAAREHFMENFLQ